MKRVTKYLRAKNFNAMEWEEKGEKKTIFQKETKQMKKKYGWIVQHTLTWNLKSGIFSWSNNITVFIAPVVESIWK